MGLDEEINQEEYLEDDYDKEGSYNYYFLNFGTLTLLNTDAVE